MYGPSERREIENESLQLPSHPLIKQEIYFCQEMNNINNFLTRSKPICIYLKLKIKRLSNLNLNWAHGKIHSYQI